MTSFIDNKDKAIGEYLRVLKVNGFLILIPIYYNRKPTKNILDKVSEVIGVKINFWKLDFWLGLIENNAIKNKINLELIYQKAFLYEDVKKNIPAYSKEVFKKLKIHNLNQKELRELKTEYIEMLKIFNENLKYVEYSILIFQKRTFKDESELFISKIK